MKFVNSDIEFNGSFHASNYIFKNIRVYLLTTVRVLRITAYIVTRHGDHVSYNQNKQTVSYYLF